MFFSVVPRLFLTSLSTDLDGAARAVGHPQDNFHIRVVRQGLRLGKYDPRDLMKKLMRFVLIPVISLTLGVSVMADGGYGGKEESPG